MRRTILAAATAALGACNLATGSAGLEIDPDMKPGAQGSGGAIPGTASSASDGTTSSSAAMGSGGVSAPSSSSSSQDASSSTSGSTSTSVASTSASTSAASTSASTSAASTSASTSGSGGASSSSASSTSASSSSTGGGCTPINCQSAGATCGLIDDGCGNSLDCGTCSYPAKCGYGGKANQCACSISCSNGIDWKLSPATSIASYPDGNIWITKTVPTDKGWGVFWLREDPQSPKIAKLYYAHVDFQGNVTQAATSPTSTPIIPWRSRYYNVAWFADHFVLLMAEGASLYSYKLSVQGVASNKTKVGPQLPYNVSWDQEVDSDIDAYPGGLMAVIEGYCGGHSCSYAFRLKGDGTPNGSVYNITDSGTHTFFPKSAHDGSGFATIVVKDILTTAGSGTRYWADSSSSPGSYTKVIPAKNYLWDERLDIAHNGKHFAAQWTENSVPKHGAPWQIHFATFKRDKSGSTLLHDKLLDKTGDRAPQRWVSQIHAVGCDWVGQYPRWQQNAESLAVYQLLDDDGNVKAELVPFKLNADALGSSVQTTGPGAGTLGIARGYVEQNGQRAISFQRLAPPSCK